MESEKFQRQWSWVPLILLGLSLAELIAGLIWRRLFRDTQPSFESTSIAPDLEQFQG